MAVAALIAPPGTLPGASVVFGGGRITFVSSVPIPTLPLASWPWRARWIEDGPVHVAP